MTSKTIALAATAFIAVAGLGAALAETTLPSIATPPPAAERTLVHANGYSISVPNDWLVATDVEGVDFMFAPPDVPFLCQTFSEKEVITAEDADIKPVLGTENLGEELFNKLLFAQVPKIAYLSTAPQPDHPGGWPFQRAVATGEFGGKPSTVLAYATFKAKNVYYGACVAETPVFEANKAKMEQAIDAIRITK